MEDIVKYWNPDADISKVHLLIDGKSFNTYIYVFIYETDSL